MKDFTATAHDGSEWVLSAQTVVDDMMFNEEPDDRWPLPITREVVLMYLQDNTEVFTWELLYSTEPDPYRLVVDTH